jgi:hypothetical protein
MIAVLGISNEHAKVVIQGLPSAAAKARSASRAGAALFAA